MPDNHFHIEGLNQQQVIDSRRKYGANTLAYKKERHFLNALKGLLKEPMILLLFVASSIYFISGAIQEGIFLATAIVLEIAISLYQDSRSRNALEQLKAYTESNCKVIREQKIQEIKSVDLVVGDSLLVEEGVAIPADGTIVHSNDFSVNESILTGESLSVPKDSTTADNTIYRGTNVVSGLAVATVIAVGLDTKLGKIGKSLENISEEKTPLELQINDFIKKMAIVGALVFFIVWGINFFRTHDILASLLEALTLAMSILPEEIPVAFTTFMALGAWRLMKTGIIVKQMKTVETLGSATVICTDKTGTLTENRMSLARLYVLSSNTIITPDHSLEEEAQILLSYAMWASEPLPFDPMEVALHEAYENLVEEDVRKQYKIIQEYPLGGKPPMMTHIFEDITGHRIIAAKGAPEALMQISNLSAAQKKNIEEAISILAADGFRVLAVGVAGFTGAPFPKTQQEFTFSFNGLVAFYDPPKENIKSVLEGFYKAGIKVQIVTGDNAATTAAIAKQIGFLGYEKSLSGDALMALEETALQKRVADTYLFTRMFPEAKLRIINALKANGQIVAMTGDGVNDGPALKAAHIGIAMGRKGTEIAKQAASLILMEDDLSKMLEAVAMGRKIYANLKKAIQYIISIHIPIILTVFLPLALGWSYPNIFSPIHIIFLELIMGPTCSIIYENEPIEANTMLKPPRAFTATFFNRRELTISIIQGLIITIGTLFVYQYAVYMGFNESVTRTMIFTVLIVANIILTLVNRSFYYSLYTTLWYKNNMVPLIIVITIAITLMLIYAAPLADFFHFESLRFIQLAICILVGCCSVIWFEGVKWIFRIRNNY